MKRDLAFPLMITVLLTGCESYLPSQPRFRSTILLPKGHVEGNNALVRTPTKYMSNIVQPVPASCEHAEAGGATQAQRNDCIIDLETDINSAFKEYQIQLQSDISKTNSVLNITGIGLSAASTAAGGTTAKTILSAVATGVGGVKTSISEDFLFKSTLQTLSSQMVADRSKISAHISASMKLGLDAYPLRQAYGELLDYYYAGTLLSALQTINTDTGVKAVQCNAAAQTAQDAAKGLVSANAMNDQSSKSDACGTVYSYNYGAIGTSLNAIWRPDGTTFDDTAQTKLQTCIKKLNITVDLATLIYGSNDSDKNRVLGCYQASL